MSRIDEIAERLDARLKERGASSTDELGVHWRDIAFLLAEVKRLEGERDRIQGLAGIPQMALIGDRDRANRRANSAEALALSLAEALERGSDYLAVLEENIMRNDADMHLDECQPPSVVVRDMSAALSSPALLKLKGGV